jgi:two-component system nitrogen regulation response regulator NtrX
MQTILIVDDEAEIRSALQGVLEDEGYATMLSGSGEDCLETLRRKPADVVLLDIWLPGRDGLDILEAIMAMSNPPEVIMISGHGSIDAAVRATKLGAFDFLEKPLSAERTLIVLKNAVQAKRLRSENLEYRKQFLSRSVIAGDSVPMKALRQQIGLMAPTNGRVLIYGESGTGKELVARAIHAQSLRKEEMFVEVNCAAIPEDLIESELFGHRKGAFATAAAAKEGKFRKADGGTLFLDEVGDMSLKTQSKVLRTLDEGRFFPLGEDEPVTVDVRVIAATNKNLEDEISRGNFREDLFYRLNVIPFYVPPLRERKEDIPLLARFFLKEFSHTYNRHPKEIADEAIEALLRYSWPGNVRELRNAIERAVLLSQSELILPEHLPTRVREAAKSSAPAAGELGPKAGQPADAQQLEDIERQAILQALQQHGFNRTETAKALGISRRALVYKLQRYRNEGFTVE